MQEFQDCGDNDRWSAAPEALHPFLEDLFKTEFEFDSSRPLPDDTVVSMLNQADSIGHSEHSSKYPGSRLRTEIPYGEIKIVLVSDRQEKVGEALYRATGNVVITFRDMVITCDEAEYGVGTLQVKTQGKTRFRQDKVSLESSGTKFDFDTQSIIFYDASGYFYDTVGRTDREFFLTGGMVQTIKADRLQFYWDTMKIDGQ